MTASANGPQLGEGTAGASQWPIKAPSAKGTKGFSTAQSRIVQEMVCVPRPLTAMTRV